MFLTERVFQCDLRFKTGWRVYRNMRDEGMKEHFRLVEMDDPAVQSKDLVSCTV